MSIETESHPSEKETLLLGLLAEEPIHAYGLEEKIRTRHMDLWTDIGTSSIYRVLAGLEERGLITTRFEQGGQGAARKVHDLTASGRHALAEGALCFLGICQPLRNPFLAGLMNITRAPRARILTVLRAREQRLEEVHEELSELEQQHMDRLPDMEPEERRLRFRLTLELIFGQAQRHIQAEKSFISESIVKIEDSPAGIFPDFGGPGSREERSP
ncbi:MAG: helix-turn-helix transcriptional regulator [Deltaproteobacteria bacterium]|nr:helix-turn-helix transcriptional regulator [Deltaproteobacteria bacterium]